MKRHIFNKVIPSPHGSLGGCHAKWNGIQLVEHLGVSKNRGGPPKSSILRGFSLINHPFWGTPIFRNTHLCRFFLCFSWKIQNFLLLLSGKLCDSAKDGFKDGCFQMFILDGSIHLHPGK